MKLKSIVITSAIALGLSFSAQASTAESAIERLVGSLITSAVTTTQAEISQEVQQNIANVTYHLALTDLPEGFISVKELANNTQADSEKTAEE